MKEAEGERSRLIIWLAPSAFIGYQVETKP
jgi:hypothetical protein